MARRWLVLGGTGMLGQDLDALLRSRGESVVSLGSAGCDVTELETV
ncbi:MAG: dTDP-4-dehydrorhamnose reductase, partial [Dermacoccus nishinomiyaensis]